MCVFHEFYLKAAPEHIEILQSQRQFLLRLNSINDTLILHESKNADFTRRNEIFLDNLKEIILNVFFNILLSFNRGFYHHLHQGVSYQWQILPWDSGTSSWDNVDSSSPRKNLKEYSSAILTLAIKWRRFLTMFHLFSK